MVKSETCPGLLHWIGIYDLVDMARNVLIRYGAFVVILAFRPSSLCVPLTADPRVKIIKTIRPAKCFDPAGGRPLHFGDWQRLELHQFGPFGIGCYRWSRVVLMCGSLSPFHGRCTGVSAPTFQAHHFCFDTCNENGYAGSCAVYWDLFRIFWESIETTCIKVGVDSGCGREADCTHYATVLCLCLYSKNTWFTAVLSMSL